MARIRHSLRMPMPLAALQARAIRLAAATLLALTGASALAADWHAAPTGSASASCVDAANACTIQRAIDVAAAYDTVRVAAGDYAFAANRIRIEKEGLRLVGDNSPFAAAYGSAPGQVAPGTLGNKAANASTLKAASAAAASGGASGMIWVRNVRNVRVENLYIEINATAPFLGSARAKEGVVASGNVDGLALVNNYLKVSGGTGAIAIGINVNGTSDSSVPSGEGRVSGNFVTLDGNVIEPTASASAAPKRAIAMENQVGLIRGNQLAATTQDLWIQYANANPSAPTASRLLTIEDNWFFGKLQIYLSNGYNLSGPTRIRNNHFVMYGSTFSPPGLPSISLGNGSEAHSLRLMNSNGTQTIVEGNAFQGFRAAFRAVWIQNRTDVLVQDNVFTPDPGQADFTAVLVGNRDVWNGVSSPIAYGATFLRNTFNANGASAANKAKAILFVNDNDPSGLAPGGTLQVGDGTQANANVFDAGIGWYVALDDRSCSGNNHNSSGACNGTSAFAIGEAIAYSSGSSASTQKRPFRWDVSASGNTFGGVFMPTMTAAQFNAVLSKTYDDRNNGIAAATLGTVGYGYTPPATGTVVWSVLESTYDGNPRTITASIAEDASATCTVTPSTIGPDAGSTSVSAVCVGATHVANATATATIARALSAVELEQSSFNYTNAPHPIAARLAAEPSALCAATPTSVRAIGTHAIAIAACTGVNHRSDATTLGAIVGGGTSVHVVETGLFFATVADALADAQTLAGHTIELAPGTYAGSIVLTKAVKLTGGAGFTPLAPIPGPVVLAGPDLPPATIIDGGNVAGTGITIASGVTGASIAGFEIRNFTGNCIDATNGNDNLVIEQNLIHHCGLHGIHVNGNAPGGITGVTLDHNEVHTYGGRGIVVWNGIKRDITISHNEVHNALGAGCCGIELQDGVATGAWVTDNDVHDVGDSGISAVQLTAGSPSGRINHVARNIVTRTGRFGIEVKIPNGTGAGTGDGAILVEDNTVDGGGLRNLRDRAGIAVYRRSFGTYPFQVDQTRGVIVRDNTVSGFRSSLVGHEGHGIVIEGAGSLVELNTLSGNDVGLQIQQANPNGLPPGDSDQDATGSWFNRGNAPLTCVSVDANVMSANALDDQRQVPAGASMLGSRVLNVNTGIRYCSINAAVAAATAGDVIAVDAGVHAEDVVIDKAITLRGAKHGQGAGVGSTRDASTGETILVPATLESSLTLTSSNNAVVFISADGVTLDGLLIDADNPALTSPVTLNGTNPDVSLGIETTSGGLVLHNLIVRNAIYSGVAGYALSGSKGNNRISDNRFVNITSPSAYGIGVALLNNFYAEVTGNLMDEVRVGVQTNNNSAAAPAGTVASISNNEIHAARTGIFHNLFYSSASPYTITGNVIQAKANAAQVGQWNGLWVESMMSAQRVTIEANTIEASAVPTRTRVAYLINNLVSSEAANTAIDGGGVSHVDIGVLATDATYYSGAVNDIIVRNVDFLEVALGAIVVEDTIEVAGSARATFGSGNTFTAVGHELVLSGTAPSVGGSASDVLVRSARNFVNGSAGVAPCAPACTVANASINAGIGATSVGGTVHVEDGTFTENVIVAKAVTVLGPHAGVPGDDPSRGSAEAVLMPTGTGSIPLTISNASHVAIDGLQIQGVNATRVINVIGGPGGNAIRIANNRLLDYVSTHSTGVGINAGSTNGLVVSGNLFEDFANGAVGTFAMGLRVDSGVDASISGNVFRHVQSVAMQYTQNSGTQVTGNRVDGLASGYTNAGVQVVTSSNVLVRNNDISGAAHGLLIHNGNSNVRMVCNRVTASTYGVTAQDRGLNPPAQAIVLHNSLHGDTADVNNSASFPVTPTPLIGSNWYGGSAPSVLNAALVADALVADPTNGGAFDVAACGDNSATALSIHAASSPQNAVILTAFADLQARVVDALGGAVTGGSVAFSAVAAGNGASASLGSAATATDHNGIARTTATANGTAGSHSVTASSGAFAVDFALTNTQGTANVAIDAPTLSQIYTGASRVVTATTTPAGLAYSVTYNGSTTAPFAAGSYAVVVTVTDPDYTGTDSGVLLVDKATGSVAWDDLSFTYDGNTHVVTAHIAEEPATSCVVVGTVGAAAGSYSVSATCSGINYDASGTATAIVSAQPTTIALSHLVQAWDGSPKSVVAATAPTAGLPLAITYDGNPLAPNAIGSYAVVATLTDANYSAVPATGTLQIVPGGSDIALVLNGPVDPVYLGDSAQYAATMLANPALHAGETFGYRLVVSKAGGTHALELTDLETMEVFYGGNWVDATTLFGSIPFVIDGNGDLVYVFPQGIPGYAAGFPIEDPSWTWNMRFTFADTGTYTTTAELVDGVSHAPIAPAVTASIATVVIDALPPDDMHLVLGGPAADVEVGAFAEYHGTLIADPAEHIGETFFVKVRLSRSGGALLPVDLAQTQIFLGGNWVDGASLGVVFTQDGDDLVYLFPESQLPGGFPIEDAEWSWSFRIAYAQAGVYSATAEVIPAYQAGLANPDVYASAAIATTVVPAVVVPPDMHLVLLGPVDDVEANTPATYTGTLLANPAEFSGRQFWVRVRLSKNGGTSPMEIADLARMELHQGSWQDVTTVLQPLLIDDGDDLVYLFPQPASTTGFPIDEAVWTWNFRFTYANTGLYTAVADIVDAADANPLAAASLANATVSTQVIAQSPDISLQLQGPVADVEVGVPATYIGTLENHGPALTENAYVKVRVELAGETLVQADITATVSDGAGGWLPGTLAEVAGGLEVDFPDAAGFPVDAGFAFTHTFRLTYHRTGVFSATARVLGAPSGDLYAVANMDTEVVPPVIVVADIALDPASLLAVYDGQAHAVTATTTPAGLAYSVNYNGSPTVPVAAGSYTVVATVTDSSHTAATTSGTLVITKATGVVAFASTTFVFDGSAHAATALIAQEPGNTTACVITSTDAYPRTDAGSSALSAICDGINHTASGAATLVVTPKPVSIALAGLGSFPYDANPHAATATVVGTVAGFPAMAVLAYNGAATVPLGVGVYDVVAMLDPAALNYSAPAVNGTIIIGAANATLSIGNIAQVYDGSERPVTVTTVPAGLATSVSYAGLPSAPTDAGTYTVVATITEPGYSGSISATLVVAKAPATIVLSNLAQVYDGTLREVGVTTSPSGLATSVSYDGGTAPIAVGTYAVLATITDTNHVGTTSATLHVTHGPGDAIAANGVTAFTGVAGQPLVGALPSVRVVDTGGNPVQGVSVNFAPGSASGVLSGATQVTNQNGIATLGGWTLDATVGTDTVTASAVGVTGSVLFTATSSVSAAGLSVTVGDGRAYAQFERTLTFTITVGNAGPSNLVDVSVQAQLPPELSEAGAVWQCIAVASAQCTTIGSGHIVDSVDLPAGSSAVYLLTALATRDGSDRISLTVDATGPAGVISATDTTDLVFFRDGFDPGGDGSNGSDNPLAAIETLGPGTLLLIDVADAPAAALVAHTLAEAIDGAFRVEGVRIGGDAWVRLVRADGVASAWARVDEGGHIALAVEAGSLLLAGSGQTLALPIAASSTIVLRVAGD